jgi:hypothetical protein
MGGIDGIVHIRDCKTLYLLVSAGDRLDQMSCARFYSNDRLENPFIGK